MRIIKSQYNATSTEARLAPGSCTVGCPILLKILQTFLSKKYVIPVYEMFRFQSFQSFPASS